LRGLGHKKNPHPFPGAGFLESRLLLLRRALTRTSVGNKKYEYEHENRHVARMQPVGNQGYLIDPQRAAYVVAMRHVTDRNRNTRGLSTLWCKNFMVSSNEG
jgi:hypothetical protein